MKFHRGDVRPEPWKMDRSARQRKDEDKPYQAERYQYCMSHIPAQNVQNNEMTNV